LAHARAHARPRWHLAARRVGGYASAFTSTYISTYTTAYAITYASAYAITYAGAYYVGYYIEPSH